MFFTKDNYIKKNNNGYVLLFSVLISGIILAIGIGIANITLKSIILSSASRDSQFAFYAADGGGECALYWDTKHGGFTDTVFATSTESTPPSSGVSCNGQDIASSWVISNMTATSADTVFSITLSGGVCSTILVSKTDSGGVTKIESRGYNTCDINFPRRLERAIRITY